MFMIVIKLTYFMDKLISYNYENWRQELVKPEKKI